MVDPALVIEDDAGSSANHRDRFAVLNDFLEGACDLFHHPVSFMDAEEDGTRRARALNRSLTMFDRVVVRMLWALPFPAVSDGKHSSSSSRFKNTETNPTGRSRPCCSRPEYQDQHDQHSGQSKWRCQFLLGSTMTS
jgi:hypothetical protein